jgi:hypothetical protein
LHYQCLDEANAESSLNEKCIKKQKFSSKSVFSFVLFKGEMLIQMRSLLMDKCRTHIQLLCNLFMSRGLNNSLVNFWKPSQEGLNFILKIKLKKKKKKKKKKTRIDIYIGVLLFL